MGQSLTSKFNSLIARTHWANSGGNQDCPKIKVSNAGGGVSHELVDASLLCTGTFTGVF